MLFRSSACSCITTPSHQSQNTTSPPASLRKIILSDPPNIISSNYTRNIQNNDIIISNTKIDDNICDTSQPVISHRISSPSPSTVVVPSNLHHYSIQNPDTMNVIPNNMNIAPNNMNTISNNKNMKQINLSIKAKVAKEKINNDFVDKRETNSYSVSTAINTVKQRDCPLDNQLMKIQHGIKLNENQIQNLRIASKNALIKSKEIHNFFTKFLHNTERIDSETERGTGSIDQRTAQEKRTFQERGTLLGLGSSWRSSSSLKKSSECSSPSKSKECDGLIRSLKTSWSSSPRNPVHKQRSVSTEGSSDRDRELTDTERSFELNGSWDLILEEDDVRIYELFSTGATGTGTGTSLYIAQCDVKVRTDCSQRLDYLQFH